MSSLNLAHQWFVHLHVGWAKKEKKMWGWSPLYHVFKRHPMASSPQCPWYHTKQELHDILAKLEKETEPFSLECECPHIV
jgi:hypothetical protein